MSILVKNGGILTTVQDTKRTAFQAYGVSPAGPMDQRAFAIANILVGNARDEACLEMTVLGPQLLFQEDAVVAVTGADFGAAINGDPLPRCQAVAVKSGDLLTFGPARNGARGYLAIAGGLDLPEVMESKATLVRNGVGGYKGRKLQEGDELKLCASVSTLPRMEERRVSAETYEMKEIVLRVVLGPQDKEFTREAIHQFFWNSMTVTDEFDRMGCRLSGKPIPHIGGDGNTITDGIAFGSIQVPTNGLPIIMLADHQTTGGFKKIGTVASVDIPRLVQVMPGCRVRFVNIGIELAQDLYLRQKKELDNLDLYLNKKS